MAISRIQITTGTTAATFPTSLGATAFPSATTARSTIFVAAFVDGLAASTLFTVTDNFGNTYRRLGTVNINATGQLDTWACFNNKGGAAHVVTIGNLANTTAALICEEWKGIGLALDALSSASDATSTSTVVVVPASTTTAVADEVVFYATGASVASAAFTTATGYSNLNQLNTSPSTLGLQSKIIAAQSTQSATNSFTGAADWFGIIVSIPIAKGAAAFGNDGAYLSVGNGMSRSEVAN